jgi:hypothetical protein
MGESNHVSTAKIVFSQDGSWMALTGPETSCGHIHFISYMQLPQQFPLRLFGAGLGPVSLAN